MNLQNTNFRIPIGNHDLQPRLKLAVKPSKTRKLRKFFFATKAKNPIWKLDSQSVWARKRTHIWRRVVKSWLSYMCLYESFITRVCLKEILLTVTEKYALWHTIVSKIHNNYVRLSIFISMIWETPRTALILVRLSFCNLQLKRKIIKRQG